MTSTRSALVIGGTGPTGPHVVTGLLDRGFDVTVLHRGTHEAPGLPDVPHIHADPHFRETIDEALGSSSFDVVVAMYGRTRFIAESLQGRCRHFLCVTGMPVYEGYYAADARRPHGLRMPTSEAEPTVGVAEPIPESVKFSQQIARTEEAVLSLHPSSTRFRYSMIYGRHNLIPREWSIVRRVRDGRRRLLLPDGGTTIWQRCAAKNAAQFLLLAIDRPDVAAGQVYNVADDRLWTVRQWAELVLDAAGGSFEFVSVPSEVAAAFAPVWVPAAPGLTAHLIFSIEKAKNELGYRDVIEPEDAVRDVVKWLMHSPLESSPSPAFVDTFDYDAEDAVMDAYELARDELRERFPSGSHELVHAMPHPKQPGAVDHRGR